MGLTSRQQKRGKKKKKHAQKNKSHCAEKQKEKKTHMSSMLQCLHQSLNEVRLLLLRLVMFLFLIISMICVVFWLFFFPRKPVLLFGCFKKLLASSLGGFPAGFSKEHPRSKALALGGCPWEQTLERGLFGPVTFCFSPSHRCLEYWTAHSYRSDRSSRQRRGLICCLELWNWK